MPHLLSKLLSTRKAVKAEMKKPGVTPKQKLLLNARQTSLKLIGKSDCTFSI